MSRILFIFIEDRRGESSGVGKKAGRKATHVTEQSPFLYGYNWNCLLSFRCSFSFRSEPYTHTQARTHTRVPLDDLHAQLSIPKRSRNRGAGC